MDIKLAYDIQQPSTSTFEREKYERDNEIEIGNGEFVRTDINMDNNYEHSCKFNNPSFKT